MSQEYLRIARDFMKEVTVTPTSSEANKRSSKSVTPERPEQPSDTGYEINEINELSTSAGGELSIAKAYESKATIPGQKPPLQQIEELQAWLSTIDWGYGLRCGKSGYQCLVCKGIPCHGSTEYQPTRN